MGRIPLSPASSLDGMGPLEQFQDMPVDSSPSHLQPCVALSEIRQGFGSDYSRCHGTLPVKGQPSYTSNPQALTPPVGYHRPDVSAGGVYGAESGQASYLGYAYPPYTPEMSPQAMAAVDDAMHIRGGLNISKRLRSADSRQFKPRGVEKRRKLPKGAPKAVSLKKPFPLQQPLSEIIRKSGDTDVFDVVVHVHRSSDIRKEEALKEGKVKRPLNAFLLYRKHVISYVKKELLGVENKNNQQLVSRICGDSWRLETDDIKTKFRQLAIAEKTRHGLAFPRYKYTPKPGKKPDGDDSGKMERNKPVTNDVQLYTTSGAGERFDTSSPYMMAGHYSFGLRAEGAGMEAMAQQGLYGEDTYPCPPNVQPLPLLYEPPYPGQHGMSALPEAGHGWGQGMPAVGNSAHSPHSQVEMAMCGPLRGIPGSSAHLYIDPSLLPGMGDAAYAWLPREDVLRSHPGWQRPHRKTADDMMAVMPDLDMNGAHNAYLRGGQSDWHVEPLDDTGHFNDWMAQEESAGT